MSFDTVITCHANADNDALASLVGALALYPDAVLLFPGTQEKQVQDFFDVVMPGMVSAGCSKELVEKSFSGVRLTDDIKTVKNIEKLSYYLSPYPPKKISADNDDRFYVVDFNIGNVDADFSFGEMNMVGVNKGTAIERFMEHIGAPISDSIAFGDSGNDLEMMHCAGIAVAMGNATDPIKKVADYVTTAVDKDGIYNAFVHLGLI